MNSTYLAKTGQATSAFLERKKIPPGFLRLPHTRLAEAMYPAFHNHIFSIPCVGVGYSHDFKESLGLT